MRHRWCVVGLAWATVACAADVKVVEEIVAKVNNEVITSSEIAKSRKDLEAALRQQGLSGANLEQAKQQREKDLLRDRIDSLLLVQKGKEMSINVDTEVSKSIAEIQLRYKIGDLEKFQKWIHDQTGMSYEDFKADMKNERLRQRVIGQEVGSRVHVPKAELAKYYAEHKSEFVRDERVFLREILVSTEGKPDKEIPALEKKAKDLVTRAHKGEKFTDLVRDNSDADTAQSGGELPPFPRGQLAKNIEDVVFSHEKNYVTDPIRISKGFLILKVEDRYKAGQATFEEVEPDIHEKLFGPLFQPEIRKYLTKLRMEAFLEIREGYVDSGAPGTKDTRWRDPAQLKPATVSKEEVASRPHHKKLVFVPVPGTRKSVEQKSSKS
jgi:peptidyl-prolyl cis-trans isomerase SurA